MGQLLLSWLDLQLHSLKPTPNVALLLDFSTPPSSLFPHAAQRFINTPTLLCLCILMASCRNTHTQTPSITYASHTALFAIGVRDAWCHKCRKLLSHHESIAHKLQIYIFELLVMERNNFVTVIVVTVHH